MATPAAIPAIKRPIPYTLPASRSLEAPLPLPPLSPEGAAVPVTANPFSSTVTLLVDEEVGLLVLDPVLEVAFTRVGLLAPQGLFAVHADWQPESPLQFLTQPSTSRVHVKYGIV